MERALGYGEKRGRNYDFWKENFDYFQNMKIFNK